MPAAAAVAPKRTSKQAAVQNKPAEESKAPAATGVRRKAKQAVKEQEKKVAVVGERSSKRLQGRTAEREAMKAMIEYEAKKTADLDVKPVMGSGCINVMLAHNYDPEKHDVTGWLMSEKLDGVRCYWNGKSMYTRNGNPFFRK